MKCLRCYAEIQTNGVCSKCGLFSADFKQEIEVAYKDFKTLELLEIRQKIHAESLEAESEILSEKEVAWSRSPAGSKRLSSILMIAAATLGLALGGYFLFCVL